MYGSLPQFQLIGYSWDAKTPLSRVINVHGVHFSIVIVIYQLGANSPEMLSAFALLRATALSDAPLCMRLLHTLLRAFAALWII